MSFDMLTPDAMATIHNGGQVDEPVLQILGIRKILSETRERYRLAVSDGKHFGHAMLATKLNKLVAEEKATKLSLIRLLKFVQNNVQDKKIVIIADAEVVVKDVDGKLGAPVSVTEIEKQNQNQGLGRHHPGPQEATMPQDTAGLPTPDVKPNVHNANPYTAAGAGAATTNPYARNTDTSKSNPYSSNRQGAASMDMGGPEEQRVPGGTSNFCPIAGLNPYGNKWTIKGRVTKKSDIRQFKNGNGKLFSFHFLDESAEMKCVVFTDFVDKYMPLIEKGKLYTISGGDLKAKNAQYNNLSSNYELIISGKSEIIEVADQSDGIPQMVYNFQSIESLSEREPGTCDIIAVVKSIEPVGEIVTKAGKELKKRNLGLVDETANISCTLWGDQAVSFPDDGQPHIISIKDARLSDFNHRSLSVGFQSEMEVDPDIPRCHALRGWYQDGGAQAELKTMSSMNTGPSRDPYSGERKPLSAIQDENLGTSLDGKADYLTAKAIVHIRRDKEICYQACPAQTKLGRDCQKKLLKDNGKFRCESCDETFGEFKWRMMMSVMITDHTDSLWVTLFQDSIEVMLQHDAQYMGDLQESENTEALNGILDEMIMKEFIVTIRVKSEMYQGTPSVRATVARMVPVDHAKEAERLLKEIP